jgi:hypothetical protein
MQSDFRRGLAARLSFGFLSLILFATYAWSQAELGGRLRGQVTDNSKAAISNADVTLKNIGTSASRTTKTNEQGEYVFVDVPPGLYSVSVQNTGFKKAEVSGVQVNLNEVRLLNFTLEIGAQSEIVTVDAQAESVVPQETTLRGLIDPQRIKELPLNGRNFQDLVFLAPGVARSAGNTGQGSGFATAGARPTVNNFLIDGGDANDPTVPFGTASNFQTSAVPVDALEEFSVITSNATAEFGRSSGATINVVSKSGTNTLHGSAWEFLRNDVLDSRDYFDPNPATVAPGQRLKTPFRQNVFGFRLGGPVFKDRTFYSVSYEGYRQRLAQSTTAIVPSPGFKAALTNPFIAAVFKAAYPNPDTGTFKSTFIASDPSTWTGTISTPVNSSVDQDTGFVRLDHRFTENHQVFTTLSIVDGVSGKTGNGIPGTGVGTVSRAWHGVFNHNWTLGNSKLNTFRVAFQRTPFSFPAEDQSAALLAAGALRPAGPFKNQPFSPAVNSVNGVPTVQFNAGTFTRFGVASNIPQGRATNTFSYQDTFSWVTGRHQIKFGGDFRRIQENGSFDNVIRPLVTIDDSSFNSINSGALIAQSQNFYLFNNTSERGFRYSEINAFVQDSFRIHPRLTIDYGVRYELNLPFTEVQNALSNAYVMQNGKPQECQSLPLGAGMKNVAVVIPSKFGIDVYCTDYNNFAPRVGFAWDTFGNGKTVLRGSYGVFYDRTFGNVFGNARFNAPFVVPTTISTGNFDGQLGASLPATVSPTAVFTVTSIDPALRTPYTQRWNLTLSRELFDRNTVLNVSYVGSKGTKLLQTTRPNMGTSFADAFRPTNQSGSLTRNATDIANQIITGPFSTFSHRVTNAASNFNSLEVEVSHRLSNGLSFQGAYTWAHSFDTVSDDIAGSTNGDSPFPQATINNLLAPLMAPGSTCSTANGTPSSATRLTNAVKCATGNASLTTDQAAALFSQQFISAASPHDNYGDSAFDIRHRFVGSVLYELPIGRSKHFLSGVNGFADKLISGWAASTIIDTQSGTPQIITAGTDANRDGDTNDRPIQIGSLGDVNDHIVYDSNFKPGTVTIRKFNCGAKSDPVACPFNQGLGIISPLQRVGRGFLRAPGIFNVDASLTKRTQLTERLNMQFRAEFFNVLNIVNWNRPQQSIASPNFGVITGQRGINSQGTQSREIQFGVKLEF